MSEKIIERFGNHFIVKYANIQSKVTLPTQDYNFYLVTPYLDTDYEWYDSLNSYCIEKQPSEEKLLARLYKCIDKQNILGLRKYTVAKIVTNPDLKSIDNYDVSYYRMKERLTKCAETSKFLTNEFADNPNIKSIYSEKVLANILVEEYLKCWENKSLNLELINDNLFSWKIRFGSFSNSELNSDLARLKKECGVDHVEVEIYFNGKLYPNYPPIVRVVKPPLADSLSHRISNSKMVQLSYWTPSRSVNYIVNRLHHLINTWGKIDFGEGFVQVVYSKAISELNNNLQKLSSFIDSVKQDDEIDADEEFISFNILSKSTTSTKPKSQSTSKTGWKSGTGYGTSGSTNWDPKEFVKLQAEKDANINTILGKIVDNLYEIRSTEYSQMREVISKSLLISYLKQQFTSVSLLDIKTRLPIYKMCFNVIAELLHEETIDLFDIKYENSSDTLYDVLMKLYDAIKTTQSIGLEIDESDDKEVQYYEFEITMLTTIEAMLIPLYQEYKILSEKKAVVNNVQSTLVTTNNIKQQYVETMSKFKFARTAILGTNIHNEIMKYYNNSMSNGANFNECRKRLRVEIPTFKQDGSLPIDYDSSIFVRVDESNPAILRMLVTGPKDTPYDSSCMIFDFFMPENYPSHCPYVKFVNHGGNRFNPNLYNCGKVCLSILGQSYIGPSASKSEQWNETSSLLQVMISIQAQILIEDPYFNEPGNERSMGTSSGDQHTKQYNENIRSFVMKSAMLGLLENPKLYPQFEDVIINHFKLKKDYVASLCDKWSADAGPSAKKNFVDMSNKIKALLEKL